MKDHVRARVLHFVKLARRSSVKAFDYSIPDDLQDLLSQAYQRLLFLENCLEPVRKRPKEKASARDGGVSPGNSTSP